MHTSQIQPVVVEKVDSDSDKSSVSSEVPKVARKASEAQIRHRALFVEWVRSKSGMKFGEWKSKKSEVKSEVKSEKSRSDWFKQMIDKKNSK
jgi:hypothetical protein